MLSIILGIVSVVGLILGVVLLTDTFIYGVIIIMLSLGLIGVINILSNQESIIEKLTTVQEDVNNPPEKITCQKCGKEYKDYTPYCPHCGQKPTEEKIT